MFLQYKSATQQVLHSIPKACTKKKAESKTPSAECIHHSQFIIHHSQFLIPLYGFTLQRTTHRHIHGTLGKRAADLVQFFYLGLNQVFVFHS
jgi:hypothetical protein